MGHFVEVLCLLLQKFRRLKYCTSFFGINDRLATQNEKFREIDPSDTILCLVIE